MASLISRSPATPHRLAGPTVPPRGSTPATSGGAAADVHDKCRTGSVTAGRRRSRLPTGRSIKLHLPRPRPNRPPARARRSTPGLTPLGMADHASRGATCPRPSLPCENEVLISISAASKSAITPCAQRPHRPRNVAGCGRASTCLIAQPPGIAALEIQAPPPRAPAARIPLAGHIHQCVGRFPDRCRCHGESLEPSEKHGCCRTAARIIGVKIECLPTQRQLSGPPLRWRWRPEPFAEKPG